MSESHRILFFPRAVRDLERLEDRYAQQVLADIELLREKEWHPGKIKKLRGTELWEVKTGDYRSLLLPRGRRVVIARIVNRRDLDRAVGRFDVRILFAWLREQEG